VLIQDIGNLDFGATVGKLRVVHTVNTGLGHIRTFRSFIWHDTGDFAQVRTCVRSVDRGDKFWSADRDQLAAIIPGMGTEIDDPVGVLD